MATRPMTLEELNRDRTIVADRGDEIDVVKAAM